jgi:hypothetical protein
MSLPSLYSLRAEYQALAYKLADMDIDATTIADTIEASGIMDSIAEKGQNIIMVSRSFEAHIEAIDGEIKRLTALKKHRQATADKLRDYLLANMQAAEIERIEGPLMTISIRNNPESVEVFDSNQVPAEYMRTPEPPPAAPDKTAIKAAIKSGKEIAGCRLTRTQKLHIA